MMEGFLDIVRREISRALSRQYREVTGKVTSYDPKSHSVKVNFYPDEDVGSGWMPLRTLQSGDGYGQHVAPNIGDPVTLQFHGDDREAGTVMAAMFTDKHKPVEIKEGEWLYKQKKGQSLYFDTDGNIKFQGMKDNEAQTFVLNKDGTFQLTDKNGVKVTSDTSGAVHVIDKAGTEYKTDGAGAAAIKCSGILTLGGDIGQGAFVETVSGPSSKVKAVL